jgi:polyphosphate kinase
MNQLEDPELMEAICEATSAGVPIDFIVRGFCCLPAWRDGTVIPGVFAPLR